MRSSLHFPAAIAAPIMAIAALLSGGCSSSGGGESARIRLLNVSPGYDSLDLYSERDGESETLRLQAVGYESVSEYVTLDPDTYDIRLKRAGVTSSLRTLREQHLTDDSTTTYVAFGSLGRFAVLSISEDLDEPDSGKTRIQVLNTSEAGTVDVYLTEDEASLDDATPLFTLAPASASSAVQIDSDTYRLRVTGTNVPTDVRLDLRDVTLESGQVITVILTATPGGVLLNAAFLPQQGDLTMRRNTKARVRAANGVSSGALVTAGIGGVTLMSNAIRGTIGTQYTVIDAGTQAVSLGVDGTPVMVPSQTLAAGGDYTLLAWNDADGVRATLIADDNSLPSISGKAKIRLLNGMSGLNAPLTLHVNFFPVVENVGLGQASNYAEVDGGSDIQLDVNNSTTAAIVYSRHEVSLQSGGVYTLFMVGDDAATANGVLRKDR